MIKANNYEIYIQIILENDIILTLNSVILSDKREAALSKLEG